MAGWHHWLDGHEFEWTLGVGDGQGGLVCYDSWGRKESDTTEQLNWTNMLNGSSYLLFDKLISQSPSVITIKWPKWRLQGLQMMYLCYIFSFPFSFPFGWHLKLPKHSLVIKSNKLTVHYFFFLLHWSVLFSINDYPHWMNWHFTYCFRKILLILEYSSFIQSQEQIKRSTLKKSHSIEYCLLNIS